ncbi:YdeI/OmpD-associated family protein [Maritimibacter dapengensis]|uniref:YdeI/OmpD-associated family protein n=1 Tax=Maritimibacter dapengensis TaxID=2836868 RepID=A0ABS6T5G4_9RHOB|nr:YdeI/OmpD-associated family protein [Maritimibacter dapengensis]MBV7380497.1 YdeI/OmpD-associated family protein [Maritimibacter dapengensis]
MMITDIEDYFTRGCGRCDRFDTPDCSIQLWTGGQNKLREICLDMGLSEHVKWAHPCYMHADRNIALMGAFREDFRFTFLNGSLLKDPEGVLKPGGPNSRISNVLYFTDNDGPARMEETIRAYLAELMDHAERGTKPPKLETVVEMPDELIEALDGDPELAEAFYDLTPGRQKSYAFNLNQAKKPETRFARIEKFRPKILAGKGAMER